MCTDVYLSTYLYLDLADDTLHELTLYSRPKATYRKRAVAGRRTHEMQCCGSGSGQKGMFLPDPHASCRSES
jgi:hypothetical protein